MGNTSLILTKRYVSVHLKTKHTHEPIYLALARGLVGFRCARVFGNLTAFLRVKEEGT